MIDAFVVYSPGGTTGEVQYSNGSKFVGSGWTFHGSLGFERLVSPGGTDDGSTVLIINGNTQLNGSVESNSNTLDDGSGGNATIAGSLQVNGGFSASNFAISTFGSCNTANGNVLDDGTGAVSFSGEVTFSTITIAKNISTTGIINTMGTQTLSNNSTISLSGQAGVAATASGNVTGLILPTGTDGQEFTIVNKSSFTFTFATSSTSHVADGSSDVIASLTARKFVYNFGTSLWYKVA